MAAKIVVQTATIKLVCPACNQIPKKPKYLYLSCNHSYCEACLEKIWQQPDIACLECGERAVFPITDGPKRLPDSFYISHLLDELAQKSADLKCEECKDVSVAVYRPECGSFLCNICNENYKISCGHSKVEMKPKKSMVWPAIDKNCTKHNHKLKYFCDKCEELICRQCTTAKEHSDHKYSCDTVKKTASKHRYRLNQIVLHNLDDMNRDLTKLHSNIVDMKQKIRKQGDEVVTKVDQHYAKLQTQHDDKLLESLMEQRDQLKQQVHDLVLHREKALVLQLQIVEMAQDEVMDMIHLRDVLNIGSDQELLSVKKQAVDGMEHLKVIHNKVNTRPLHSTTIEFIAEPPPQFGQLFTYANPRTSSIVDLPDHIFLGKETEFVMVSKDCDDNLCYRGGSRVFAQLESNTGTMTYAYVQDRNFGKYYITVTAQQAGAAKLSVFIDGYPIKGSPYSFIVSYNYPAVNKPTKIVDNNGTIGTTRSIAFGKNGMWAVTDTSNYCVYIYDDKDELLRKFGSKGSGAGQFEKPFGVAFDENYHLYVSDSTNNVVQEFDIDGNYLSNFGSKGTDYGELDDPRALEAYNGKVYVCEFSNHRISVFQSGDFCQVIGKEELSKPMDMKIDIANSQLIVCDTGHKHIFIFALTGECSGTFDTKGIRRNVIPLYYSPCSLNIDVNGFILVRDLSNCHLRIYDRDGNCIHECGSKGVKPGQFLAPFALALSPRGSIYACDEGSRRIQIFSTS
ncbi:tripartite motif-containing protein 2-like isoform X2 [Dysidea avara]